jgi:hypothetical protein
MALAVGKQLAVSGGLPQESETNDCYSIIAALGEE